MNFLWTIATYFFELPEKLNWIWQGAYFSHELETPASYHVVYHIECKIEIIIGV